MILTIILFILIGGFLLYGFGMLVGLFVAPIKVYLEEKKKGEKHAGLSVILATLVLS